LLQHVEIFKARWMMGLLPLSLLFSVH
jgi:hypothetical protein